MRERRVLCVSAGMTAPKKADHPFARWHLYLNYGLLGLASLMREAGFDPLVVHGRFDAPETVLDRLDRHGWMQLARPVLLSIPSSYALGWASDFCRSLKRRAPATRIIVGGRWVTADDGDWVRRQIPEADLVVYGTAESRIVALLEQKRWCTMPGTDRGLTATMSPDLAPPLDYTLLDGHLAFQPSIEVSRGCGMGCAFCAEGATALGPIKSAAQVAAELAACLAVYGDGRPVHPYLEASLFRPSGDWVRAFGEHLRDKQLSIAWRTESRVDCLTPERIEALARAGLRVLDLGLESASPRQLVAMGKASQPNVYLRRASEALRACRANGVWAKVNVLLHPGETMETFGETVDWLARYRDCIKGVSVGPTIVWRYGRHSAALVREYEQRGARLVDSDALDRDGYAHLHMSAEISHERAGELSLSLSQAMMDGRDYFDLKAFSYFPRGTKWEDFSRAVSATAARLPFRREGAADLWSPAP